MTNMLTAARIAVIALLAIGAQVFGAEATSPAAKESKSSTVAATDTKAAVTTAAKEKSKKGSPSTELKKLFDELNKQRDLAIEDYEKLQKEFKEATEEKKQEIKEKMEAQRKTFEEATAALHKQIRDEQRRQRASGAGPKR